MNPEETSTAVPTLTIAYHPHPRRIGDRLLLDGLRRDEIEVSRAEPPFVQPGRERTEELSDRNISRKPFILEHDAASGGVRLSLGESRTSVRVDGQTVDDDHVFTPEQIRRGTLIELAERVLLVLHEYAPSSESTPEIEELVGASTAFEKVRRETARLSQNKEPVLIRGVRGVNPARIGREIHLLAHQTGRFVNVDLQGALERGQNLRDVLLGGGIGEGAAEGALRRAAYGTLFLSHIDCAPTHVQEVLLHVLDHGELRVGETAEPIEVRLMGGAESSCSLEGPLLERLKGQTLDLPALRDRREDIGRLIMLFLRKELTMIGEARRVDASTDMTKWLPLDVASRLIRHDWPGDLEQLADVVHQMALNARGTDPMIFGAGLDELLQTDS